MLERIKLFDFDFISEDNLENVCNNIFNSIGKDRNEKFPFLITPNLNDIIVYNLPENSELKPYLVNSQFILPDGQPIVWSSKLIQETSLKKRLPGSDLFPLMWNKIKSDKVSTLLLVPNEEVAKLLKSENKNCFIYVLPYFTKDDNKALNKIIKDCTEIILASKIKMVLIGVTFPKQNLIAVGIYEGINKRNKEYTSYLIGMIGASFEFYLGTKKRAPTVYQKLGVEWLYRFLSEPKRLFKRYFVDSWQFIPILYAEFRNNRNSLRNFN